MDRTKMVNEVSWNTLYKEMTEGLDPYDPYYMGFVDAMDRVDDWMDAQPTATFPAVPGHTDQHNISEMAYNNGYAKGYEDGKNSGKRGHWIIKSIGHGANATNWAECSECHVCGSPQWKVCPVCETRMEKHSAINIKEVSEIDFDYAAEDDKKC